MSHRTTTGSLPGIDARAADERKAALLLHALAPAERSWFIERLAPRQAGTIRRLLEELKVLGMSADADLVREILATASSALAPPFAPAPAAMAPWDTDWQVIDAAEPLFMARLLAIEPVPLIADVLRLRDWSWAPAFLELLSPTTRESVLAALASPSNQAPSQSADAAGVGGGRRDQGLFQVLLQRCASVRRHGGDAPAAEHPPLRASRSPKQSSIWRWGALI